MLNWTICNSCKILDPHLQFFFGVCLQFGQSGECDKKVFFQPVYHWYLKVLVNFFFFSNDDEPKISTHLNLLYNVPIPEKVKIY